MTRYYGLTMLITCTGFINIKIINHVHYIQYKVDYKSDGVKFTHTGHFIYNNNYWISKKYGGFGTYEKSNSGLIKSYHADKVGQWVFTAKGNIRGYNLKFDIAYVVIIIKSYDMMKVLKVVANINSSHWCCIGMYVYWIKLKRQFILIIWSYEHLIDYHIPDKDISMI